MAGVLQHPTASQRTGRSSADQPTVTNVLTIGDGFARLVVTDDDTAG